MFQSFTTRRRRWAAAIALAIVTMGVGLHLGVPRPLFDQPTATVVTDRQGALIGARIAADEQWRFPEADSVPEKFARCIVACEDRRFRLHPGIDPIAIARALAKNIRTGRVTEGASTLTMQLARMARGNRSRTIGQKVIEALWALDIELSYSKDEILRLYASHAPFGGNTVGLDAAAWRYFGRDAGHLSWAESATLAVLPNAPSLIHLSRNRELLRRKRDALLRQLRDDGTLAETEYSLALAEPLPDAPLPIPNLAPHLLAHVARQHAGEAVRTSIDLTLQRTVQQMADRYSTSYKANYVDDIAGIVADVESGEVLAYVGNGSEPSATSQVDNIISERSTGSLLKPILYAAMMSSGDATPRMIFADTPLNINGFRPQNFSRTYLGIVHADESVTRSLNVPLVRMLSLYGTERFLGDLRWLGMTTLHFDAGHYGASLILGGAEGTLWNMTGMYATLARRLNHFRNLGNRYDEGDIHPLRLQSGDDGALAINTRKKSGVPAHETSRITASATWFALEAMSALNRPEEEADWQAFSSMKRVAWKTGTSWGGRDAWAIGVTRRYAVGVWTGNATGEGRAGLTGVGYAAPVMFDVFSVLDGSEWFDEPLADMQTARICRHSGHVASAICAETETEMVPRQCIGSPTCPYCRWVHLSADGAWQVNSSGEAVSRIRTEARFVLPPAQEYYYAGHTATYRPLPPVRPDCQSAANDQISVIVPEHGSTIVLPRIFVVVLERVVMHAACRDAQTTLFWHIDDRFIGQTQGRHEIAVRPDIGQHTLTLVDGHGHRKVVAFEVK